MVLATIERSHYGCDQCSLAFIYEQTLALHVRTAHLHAPAHPCDQCDRAYKDLLLLREHKREAHEEENDDDEEEEGKERPPKPVFNCPLCQKEFTSVHNVQNHRRRIHEGGKEREKAKKKGINKTKKERLVQCDVCQVTLKHQTVASHYRQEHAGVDVKPFPCAHCPRRYAGVHMLNEHIERVHGEKPIKCSFCEKRFAKNDHLKSHLLVHEERRFKCADCDATATTLANLNIHYEGVHFRIHRFHCSYCDRTFTQKAAMNDHENLHVGARPYLCAVCGKTFAASSTWISHRKRKRHGN